MKRQDIYAAPAIETMEVAIENGIAQSGAPAPGNTGTVTYDPVDDHYEF
jgi:hypothetical protein